MFSRDDSEPVSHIDAAWLRMDSPQNPMVITSALLFDGPVPFEAIRRAVEDRFLPNIRFRQRVIDSRLPLVSPRWELDPDFDIRAHLHHVRLPAPGGESAFEDFVSELMSTRLDSSRPLWQTYVIDDAPGGTAVVSRIHHCIGDGVSLVKILVSFCDDVGTRKAPQKVGVKRARRPQRPADLAKRAASQAATIGRLLLLPVDPPTPLRGPLGTTKRVARARPYSLEAIKTAAHRSDAKVNDLLTAAVAGMLRDYLGRQGVQLDGLQLRTLVPVFLSDDSPGGLGNHFGLVFLDLPLFMADAEERVREIKHRMDRLKSQDDATIAFAVLDLLGIASHDLEHIYLEVFSRKASLLTSNVPGPQEGACLAGVPLREMAVWAPVTGYLGTGVTFMSYNGEVFMTVHADAKLVSDPRQLVEGFEREMNTLLRLSSEETSAHPA